MLDSLMSRSHLVSFRPTSRRQRQAGYYVPSRVACLNVDLSYLSALWVSCCTSAFDTPWTLLVLVPLSFSSCSSSPPGLTCGTPNTLHHPSTGFQGGRNPDGTFPLIDGIPVPRTDNCINTALVIQCSCRMSSRSYNTRAGTYGGEVTTLTGRCEVLRAQTDLVKRVVPISAPFTGALSCDRYPRRAEENPASRRSLRHHRSIIRRTVRHPRETRIWTRR